MKLARVVSVGRSDLIIRLLDQASEVRVLQHEFWDANGKFRKPDTVRRAKAAEKALDELLGEIDRVASGGPPKTLFDIMESQGM